MISWSSWLSLSSNVSHTWKKLRSWLECLLEAFTAQGKSVFVIIFISKIVFKFILRFRGARVVRFQSPRLGSTSLKSLIGSFVIVFSRQTWEKILVLKGALGLKTVSGLCVFYYEWTATCFKVTRFAIPSLQLLRVPCIKHVCSGFVWDGDRVTLQHKKWWLLRNRDLFFIEMCCPPGAVAVRDTGTHKKSKWDIV